MCHGKIEFGREGGNFCSNPACHGRSWPAVNLNAEWTPPNATPVKVHAGQRRAEGGEEIAVR